jgi:5-formaminoimidazole-4-carboxamide-1-(beta)-D-ribofuranosyl 5'-monophosphate synthetase
LKTVATLGSHCALQLLKGAKDEGLHTLLVCLKKRANLYRRFRFIEKYIFVDRFDEVVKPEIQEEMMREDSILIPHGTLISEVGVDLVEKDLKVPIFGNRWILRWEADRVLKEKLMKEAGLETPQQLKPEEIDRLCIVKLPGAAGGRGYFLVSSTEEFNRAAKKLEAAGLIKSVDELYIQEYCVGVPVYFQYFYSPLEDRLELLGIDRRYETTVDSIGRIPAKYQLESDIPLTYIVVGNIPLVLRESLLDEAYRIGEAFVEASKKLVPPGIIGPFCIEGVYTEKGSFMPFEFSARIVAGTNLYIDGSPYSKLLYDEPMSMGRRIAREIRLGAERGALDKLLT